MAVSASCVPDIVQSFAKRPLGSIVAGPASSMRKSGKAA